MFNSFLHFRYSIEIPNLVLKVWRMNDYHKVDFNICNSGNANECFTD